MPSRNPSHRPKPLLFAPLRRTVYGARRPQVCARLLICVSCFATQRESGQCHRTKRPIGRLRVCPHQEYDRPDLPNRYNASIFGDAVQKSSVSDPQSIALRRASLTILKPRAKAVCLRLQHHRRHLLGKSEVLGTITNIGSRSCSPQVTQPMNRVRPSIPSLVFLTEDVECRPR